MHARAVAPWALPVVFCLAACGGADSAQAGDPAADPAQTGAEAAAAGADAAVSIACVPTAAGEELTGRASPYDSVRVQVGGQTAQVCYSRPSMRGRQIFGSDLVPYDTLWRTGANEPTIIHIPVAATIAGVTVEPGSYSIYTVPGQQEWQVIVNRSTSQWGHEGSYTPEVRAQEVGRGTVPAESADAAVEQFTITTEPAGEGSNLILEWENTRVRIPVQPAG